MLEPPTPVRMETLAPARKVLAASLAAAGTVLLLSALANRAGPAYLPWVFAAAAFIVTIAAGYLTAPAMQDEIRPRADQRWDTVPEA